MKPSFSTRWLLGALVIMTVCALSAPAQEQVSSLTAQNLVQPEVFKISVKGVGMLGGEVAGGSKTKFIMTPPVPGTEDGHRLIRLGGKLWSPHVNAFIKELGF